MKKTYLLTPGPTPIPESISARFAQPLIHHRTPEFEKLFAEVRKGAKSLFQTQQEVLFLAATGTGAMEAAISNLFSAGEKVVFINAGKFGERWGKISERYGLKPIEISLDAGAPLDVSNLKQTLQTHRDAKAVLFQASETSTGTALPVQEITQLCSELGLLSVCDAITACGVMDLPMDRWGIDVLITGSQKALMIPPGLALISLSPLAWKAQEKSTLPRFYFDLGTERKAHLKNQTAWTPAISLIQGLQLAFQMILEEGLPAIFSRHALFAEATRAAVKSLGLEVVAKKSPSPAVTAVWVPKSISDGKQIPKIMRDRYGVVIAGGQDELEGKIFRLSHFGYVGMFDITTGIAALEMTLKDLGHPVTLGQGVGAALSVLHRGQA